MNVMSGKINRRLMVVGLGIAGSLVLALILLDAFNLGPLSFSRSVSLSHNTPDAVTRSALDKRADPNTKLKIVVGLKLRNEAELDAFLKEVSDPNSPSFRKYLSADEFTRRFSPRQNDVDRVVAFLREFGITVIQVTPNRTLIEAEGTVQQLERAFAVEINEYSLVTAEGSKTFLSNARDPSVPLMLIPIVQSVIGLNTYDELESRSRVEPHVPASTTVPSGLSPQDVASIYDFPNANNSGAKSRLTGAGRTIAIATAHSYDLKDVEEYWRTFGIKRTGKIKDVHVGGVSTKLNGETTLDLETASAQAPGADIIMYMAVDAKFTNCTLTYNKVVTDNIADVMSISWGLCEEHTGSRQMKTEHAIFKQAAAQGIAVFAAAGDDGAYDCRHDEKKDAKGKKVITAKLSVDYPSSDPYVVAVGGTTLMNLSGSRLLEWAWHGGGGGISDEWGQPSWQNGPGVPQNDKRNSADVSLNADPSTGYAIYFEGKWKRTGGTSVSAPEWAALWILIEEAAGQRVGSPNEIFYRLGRSSDYSKTFYDITSGDNGDSMGPGYKAGDKWDHPTGWGVPKGEALKNWVVKDQKGSGSNK